MNFDRKQTLAGLKRVFGSKRNRRPGGRRSNRAVQVERLEQRAMMAALAGDAPVVDGDAGNTDSATELRTALVGERFPGALSARNVASNDLVGLQPVPSPHPRPQRTAGRDDPVSIAPLPTPYPNPDKTPGRDDPVGIAPLPTPYPNPDKTPGRDDLVGIAPLPTPYPNPDKTPGRDDPVGIAPLPSPHSRPVDQVLRVGLDPNPSP